MASKSTSYQGQVAKSFLSIGSGKTVSPATSMPTNDTASMPSRAHGRELPCTKMTTLRPTPGPTHAPQIPFHYGLPQDAPKVLVDMVKFMTSIIFRKECLETLYTACQECHWGAHVFTILGMHITWTMWKHVLVLMWILDWDLCEWPKFTLG